MTKCLSKDPSLPATANALRQKIANLVGKASDDSVTLRDRVNNAIRRGTRLTRLSYSRGAAGTDFSRTVDGDNVLNSYRNLGFNTVVVNDELGLDSSHQWIFLTDAQIEASVKQARKYNMSIILSITANHITMNDPDIPPTFDGDGNPVYTSLLIPALTPSQVKERFSKWMKYDQGEIIGVYFLSDDYYLVAEPVANQLGWRQAIREVSTDVPVLGMLGELSILADPEWIAQFYSARVFDHVLMLSYPYNLSNHPTYGPQLISRLQSIDPTVSPLNNSTSVDPEGDLFRYLSALYKVADDMYFKNLLPGQKISPVTEAFVYTGSPAGKFVHASDIYTGALDLSDVVAEFVGDDDWHPMTYFYWGTATSTFPEGIAAHSEWWDTLRLANKKLQKKPCIRTESGVLARYVLGVK